MEKAPWWGGFYERMIQLVKRSLRKVLGNAKLTYEELETVVVQVEGTLNSRPLTQVESEFCEQPLTPSHLVIGRRLATLPTPQEFSDDEQDESAIQKRARYLGRLIKHFWNRWVKEYLLNLREFHQRRSKRASKRTVLLGDVVLIHDENLPRSRWRLGVVNELIQSGDGEVRGVQLKTTTKRGTLTTLRRPVQLLYPLEIQGRQLEEEDDEGQDNEATDEPQRRRQADGQDPQRRPQRTAASNARAIINELMVDQSV